MSAEEVKAVQESKISIILPVKNIEQEIPGILRFTAEQAEGLSAEILVLDMGSSDRTVFHAVRLMKEMNLHGFVIQNGDTTVSSALNTGLQRAGGTFITFFFARRLYTGMLRPYLEAASRSGADFVYGCANREEIRLAERRSRSSVIQQKDGNEILKDVLRRTAWIDIAAILVRSGFLKEKQIEFQDSCRYGYTEEFLYNCLLKADTVVQAPAVPIRSENLELVRGKQKLAGRDIFQRVEALLRVLDTVKIRYGGDKELLGLLQKYKIPLMIMDSTDIMLREGNSTRTVKDWLRVLGYDKLLSADGKLDRKLTQRIFIWKAVPGLYRT